MGFVNIFYIRESSHELVIIVLIDMRDRVAHINIFFCDAVFIDQLIEQADDNARGSLGHSIMLLLPIQFTKGKIGRISCPACPPLVDLDKYFLSADIGDLSPALSAVEVREEAVPCSAYPVGPGQVHDDIIQHGVDDSLVAILRQEVSVLAPDGIIYCVGTVLIRSVRVPGPGYPSGKYPQSLSIRLVRYEILR